MFVVLQFKKADKGIKSKIKNFLFRPEVYSERVYYKGSVVYCSVTAEVNKGKIPWREIEQSCGRLCSNFILPFGVTPPENSRIKQYKSPDFEKLMLFNTMILYIKRNEAFFAGSNLCIVDISGSLAGELMMAVSVFSGINIITENYEAYESICKSILDDYGLSVTFCRAVHNSENTVVLCDDAKAVPVFFKGTLFCLRDVFLPDCNVIKCSRLFLDRQWERLIPEKTDPVAFLSAMHDLSGVSELHGTVYSV